VIGYFHISVTLYAPVRMTIYDKETRAWNDIHRNDVRARVTVAHLQMQLRA